MLQKRDTHTAGYYAPAAGVGVRESLGHRGGAKRRAALSQDDLAKKAGVSRATIADLETNKRPARPSTRRKLAEALGVVPAELMDPETGGD